MVMMPAAWRVLSGLDDNPEKEGGLVYRWHHRPINRWCFAQGNITRRSPRGVLGAGGPVRTGADSALTGTGCPEADEGSETSLYIF